MTAKTGTATAASSLGMPSRLVAVSLPEALHPRKDICVFSDGSTLTIVALPSLLPFRNDLQLNFQQVILFSERGSSV